MHVLVFIVDFGVKIAAALEISLIGLIKVRKSRYLDAQTNSCFETGLRKFIFIEFTQKLATLKETSRSASSKTQ